MSSEIFIIESRLTGISRGRLNLAGTLCVIIAILVIPVVAFNIWTHVLLPEERALALGARWLILVPIEIYIWLTLRRLLNERMQSHELDMLISASIWLSVISLPINFFIQSGGDKTLGLVSEVIPGLLNIVIGLMMAIRLLDIRGDLYGLRRPLAKVWLAQNITFILYFTCGVIGNGIGKFSESFMAVSGFILLAAIIAGIALQIASSLVQARIFYRAALESRPMSIGPRMQSDQVQPSSSGP